MPPYPSRELSKAFAERQEAAQEDDWRVGAIEAWLKDKKPGECTCVAEVFDAVISEREGQKPDRRSSIDIGKIIAGIDGWSKAGQAWFTKYGSQKAYRKSGGKPIQLDAVPDDMPF